MNDDIKIFIPFAKQNKDKKEVYGYVSTEALDSQGEVVEKEAIANALPAYLGDYDEKSGRYRYGNIREMHQHSAVGKTFKAKIDQKGLFIGAKVVDGDAWEKVKEGVYAGFSIGGRVVKQIQNRIKALRLSEISLVDRPANPEAVFSIVKFDKNQEPYDFQIVKDDDMMPTIPHEEVLAAAHILDLARDIRMLLVMFESDNRSTKELERALTSLKSLAAKVLRGEDKKKFDTILYGARPDEWIKLTVSLLEKRKLKTKDRKKIPSSKFAYVDSKGEKHLPIHDKAHVRNAMARFNQTNFESSEKKRQAAKRIVAAANRFNIEVSSDSAVAVAAKKLAISNYIDLNWSPGYFEKMKKVIG